MNKNTQSRKLSEISEIILGQSPKSKFYNEEGRGLPFFQGNKSFGELYPEVEKYCTKPKRKAEAGDVLITVRAPVGALNFADQECVIGRGVTAIRGTEVDSKFIYYLLKANRDLLETKAGGSVYDSITKSDLTNLELEIPNQEDRRKITKTLIAYDNLIENNKKRIEILEKMAQAIYNKWFVQFDFPGHEEVEMVDSGTEIGKVPKDWQVKKLSDLVNTRYGYTESASEEKVGPKFVRGTDINKNSYIKWEEVPYCEIDEEDYEKYKLDIGDIVVVRMGSPGESGIAEKDIDAVYASYLIRFEIESDLLKPYYLFYFLNSHRYMGWATGVSTGSTRKSASAKVLTNIDLVIPPKELLMEFEDKISTLREGLNNLLDQNKNLKKTRDLLLQDLI